MKRLDILKSTSIAFLVISTNLYSADGVVEINQACAQTGCYPGDAPGFPVFIQQPGSYRLTGNLDLSGTPDTTGVQISSPFVTLDLNGFEIAGPKICTGTGPTLDCGGVEDGAGVLIEADARAVVVRNGTVRNMGTEGIWSFADGTTIENVRAMHNARNGLRGQSNTLVTDCVAIENFDDGFDFGSGSVIRGATALGNGNDGIEIGGPNAVVDGASSGGNGNRGFNLSHSSKFSRSTSANNVGTDTCGGGICSEKKRFYITQTTHDGNEALDACADGFHMASMFEIHEWSGMAYDSILGRTFSDSGQGSPAWGGWVRTGHTSSAQPWTGSGNCSVWSSDQASWYGTWGSIEGAEWGSSMSTSQITVVPWEAGTLTCDSALSVWCAED